MVDMDRTYWVDDPTLQECIDKGRALNAELHKRGIPCDVGVIDDGYGTYWYQIELDKCENRSAAMQFTYQQLEDLLKEAAIDIAFTACRLEVG